MLIFPSYYNQYHYLNYFHHKGFAKSFFDYLSDDINAEITRIYMRQIERTHHEQDGQHQGQGCSSQEPRQA